MERERDDKMLADCPQFSHLVVSTIAMWRCLIQLNVFICLQPVVLALLTLKTAKAIQLISAQKGFPAVVKMKCLFASKSLLYFLCILRVGELGRMESVAWPQAQEWPNSYTWGSAGIRFMEGHGQGS